MPCSLHGIGVKQRAVRVRDAAQGSDVLNGADLIVGVHDGDEDASVRLAVFGRVHQGGFEVCRGDEPLGINWQHDDAATVLFKNLTGVEHRVMFDGAGDNGGRRRAGQACGPRAAGECPDVGLGSAAGKKDLARVCAQASRARCACTRYGLGCGTRIAMDAPGVAKGTAEIGQHGLSGGIGKPGGRCVVGINVDGAIRSFH